MAGFQSDSNRFILFGDLHTNAKQLAVSCEEGGADAVVFHLNQDSLAGGRFGGFELEEDSLRECLSVLKVPSGLTIGDARPLLEQEWEKIVEMGFSFVNMYAHHLPTFVWRDPRMEKMVTIGPGYILEQVKALSEFDSVSGLIAALTPNQGLGMPLTLFDVTTLKLISRLSSKPIYIPTQRRILPNDIPLLRDQGCSGILVTNTVYGDSDQDCKAQISRYREEISRSRPLSSPQTFTNMS